MKLSAWPLIFSFGCNERKDEGDTPIADDSGGSNDSGSVDDSGFDAPVDKDWILADGVRVYGDDVDDFAGYGLAVGDVDGDQLKEAVVGSPTYWQGGVHGSTPAAFLLRAGVASGALSDVAAAKWDGTGTYTNIGDSAAILGGLTGDGPTVILGGILSHPGTNNLGVPIYEGPFVGAVDTWAPSAWFLEPDVPSDIYIADDLTSCGDVDGDAIEDLCVPTGFGLDNEGETEAAIFLGPVSGELSLSDANILLVGPASAEAGRMIEGCDLNGDGLGDLLVSAPELDDNTGAVYLAQEPPLGVTQLSDFPSWTGEAKGDEAGWGVASGGDLDGDGLDDVFIGAHLAEGRDGKAYVVTDPLGGSLDDAYASFDARHALDFWGFEGAMGDFDGDGHDDLAVGIPRDIYFGYDRPGRVAVFRGPLESGHHTEDDAAAIWIGSQSADSFGMRVDAGDMDGDGEDELVVSAPLDDAAHPSAGSVTILSSGGF